MPCQVHGVVQYAQDFDHALAAGTIHQDVPPAPPIPRNMKGAQTRQNFASVSASWNLGSS